MYTTFLVKIYPFIPDIYITLIYNLIISVSRKKISWNSNTSRPKRIERTLNVSE